LIEHDDGLSVAREGAVRIVTLERPDDLNAANQPLHTALAELWPRLSADPDARAVVLTGRGRAFSAGGDFAFMQAVIDRPEIREQVMAEGRRIVHGMIRCPLPIVAAVNGPAIGLGASLALLSDVVLLDPSAVLADPHLQVGLAPGDGGAIWALHAGLLRAKEHLLLGERVSAEQAVSWGLASRIVGTDLLGEAVRIATRLAALPPVAVQATKRALNLYAEQQLEGPFEAALQAELRSMASIEHRAIVESIIARARTRA
jgi:enoyl-CoA hydratase